MTKQRENGKKERKSMVRKKINCDGRKITNKRKKRIHERKNERKRDS